MAYVKENQEGWVKQEEDTEHFLTSIELDTDES